MYRMRIAILLSFACLIPLFPQTTYYVSSSQGNDNNSGASTGSPWKSISKINNQQFNPGDNILFKRGDVWEENSSLVIYYYSGTENARITFGAYGTGNKPQISLINELEGWKDPSRWAAYSSNVWYMTTPSYDVSGGEGLTRLWFDDVEYSRAKNLFDSNLDNLSGEIETFGVNSKHRYFHSVSGTEDVLYVYTDGSNPAYYYFSLKYSGYYKPVTGTVSHTIELRDADYITFEDLDVRGGMYSSFLLNGSDYVIINNCDISRGQHGGITGDGQLSNDKTSDFVEVKNCNIDSYRKVNVNFYDGGVEYGITAGSGTTNWSIHDNYIKNWSFGFLTSANFGHSLYHKFFNNEVSAPDIEYAKPMQLGANENPFNNQFHEIFNNYFHDLPIGIQLGNTGSGLCGDFKIYFNIFENLTFSENEHTDQLNSGWGISTGQVQTVHVFNNTFYNLNLMAILSWTWDQQHYYYNNLLVNSGKIVNGIAIQDAANSSIYNNNLLYSAGKSSGENLINVLSRGGYLTVNGLNNTNFADENLQHLGSLSTLLNTNDFSLPIGSPALNSGIDISFLVPEGFKDRNGNVINRTSPDIGAIQHITGDTSPPTLVSGTLLDSTKLLLTFSEPLSSLGIASVLNYSVSDGVIVYSAELSANQTTIVLTTSPHTFGQNYSCSVYNLQDQAGNFLSATNNSITYFSIFDRPSVGYVNKLAIIKVAASNMDESPEKTIDGVYYSNGGEADSRWKATPLPQWLVYDLGAVKQISLTRISFYGFQEGRIYNYNISISKDSENWVDIVKNAASSNQEWTVNIVNPIEARFLKLELIGNNQNDWATVWETEIWGTSSLQSPIQIKPKIYLQGTYENNQMRNNLRSSNLIPLNQPYISTPWYYYGYESVLSIPIDVVDWVLIELRSDISSAAMAKRAAFVKKDGTIVDLDGQSPVNFYGISSGGYYLVVAHRNHLSIMSAEKVQIAESSVLYDFTVSLSKSYGNDLANLGDGKYGMYAGDGDANGNVNVLDYGTVGNMLFQSGYLGGDLDLNGTANVLDYGKANQNLLKVSNVP